MEPQPAMEPQPDDSPPEPRSRRKEGEYFDSPMELTPGQRVHTVEGPGRQSGTNRCIGAGQERMVNTGEPTMGFKRRSGSSFNPVDPAAPRQTSEPLPQTAEPSAESSILYPTHASSAVMAAFGSKTGGLGENSSACNWVKAKEGLDLTEVFENAQKERKSSTSFQSVVEGAKHIAEERRKAKMERQELSQYFNPSVIGSVNRNRRINSSRRTRMLILLDEPRTSRLAASVFITMLALIFVSVILVVVDSMSPPEDMRYPLWCVEIGVSVVFCLEFALRLAGTNSVCAMLSDVYMWIDFLSIVPFIVDISFELSLEGGDRAASPALDALRLARLLRLLKLARHYEGAQVLIQVRCYSAEPEPEPEPKPEPAP